MKRKIIISNKEFTMPKMSMLNSNIGCFEIMPIETIIYDENS